MQWLLVLPRDKEANSFALIEHIIPALRSSSPHCSSLLHASQLGVNNGRVANCSISRLPVWEISCGLGACECAVPDFLVEPAIFPRWHPAYFLRIKDSTPPSPSEPVLMRRHSLPGTCHSGSGSLLNCSQDSDAKRWWDDQVMLVALLRSWRSA